MMDKKAVEEALKKFDKKAMLHEINSDGIKVKISGLKEPEKFGIQFAYLHFAVKVYMVHQVFFGELQADILFEFSIKFTYQGIVHAEADRHRMTAETGKKVRFI